MSFPEIVMIVILIGAVALIVATVSIKLAQSLLEKRRKEEERKLPVYERVARAQERRAEECMVAGSFWDAKQHFKEAKKLREEAIEAIINGEEPPL